MFAVNRSKHVYICTLARLMPYGRLWQPGFGLLPGVKYYNNNNNNNKYSSAFLPASKSIKSCEYGPEGSDEDRFTLRSRARDGADCRSRMRMEEIGHCPFNPSNPELHSV
jgi:hypothetical protein